MIIKIIGLGGIGSVLSEKLSRFLNYSMEEEPIYITLVDGDSYEPKNLSRQEFVELGNKAKVKAKELNFKFENIQFDFVDNFINEENISEIIKTDDIVFICVDNHKSRNIINSYCKTLQNIVLISGGNELTDGNVQIYVREEGSDITPSLTDYHPEISNPTDKTPEEMSCEELSQSAPQLFFTNFSVAAIMCWAFYNYMQGNTNISEVYFDMLEMASDAKVRKVKTA